MGKWASKRQIEAMGAVDLIVTDTFYAKNNPTYLNLEN